MRGRALDNASICWWHSLQRDPTSIFEPEVPWALYQLSLCLMRQYCGPTDDDTLADILADFWTEMQDALEEATDE